MGGYYNLYTVSGKRTFYYRFTCGKCHKTTPWDSCCIEEKHSVQTKSSLQDVQKQLEDGLLKKLNDRIDAVRQEVATGYLFAQPSMLQTIDYPHGKCPYCGQNPKLKGAVSQASLVCGIIGLFAGMITSAVLAWFYVLETFPPMIGITLAATVVGAVIGAITESRNERRLVDHTNVQYWWNEVLPINMTGTPQVTKNGIAVDPEKKEKINLPESESSDFDIAKNMFFSEYDSAEENSAKAENALERISDIDLLKKLESVAVNKFMRREALGKRNRLLYEKRKAEVEKIHDEAELIQIAKSRGEYLDIIRSIISERITDKAALSYFAKYQYGEFANSVLLNKNIDREILFDVATHANAEIAKQAYEKLKNLNRLEKTTIILNFSYTDIGKRLLETMSADDQPLLAEIFQMQGTADLEILNGIYEKMEDHSIEVSKKIKEILHKRIDDWCTFERCNNRATLIEELIELLKKDELAAKGFWEALRRENELSNHYHVPGNSEGGEDDWYFLNYNLDNFPPYPFEDTQTTRSEGT